MPAAEYTGQLSSTGVKQRGPSGAPIWTTPTIDAKRGQVYVTTGENTSHPTTNTSDAIIALYLYKVDLYFLYISFLAQGEGQEQYLFWKVLLAVLVLLLRRPL